MNEAQRNELSDEGEAEVNLTDLLECRRRRQCSIETHGKGFAIYFGRCGHLHGANIAQITGCKRADVMDEFERRLNQPNLMFQSAASGLWYENYGAAGDISAVKIGNKVFQHSSGPLGHELNGGTNAGRKV